MKLLCYADLQATDGDELCFQQPGMTLQHYRVAKFFKEMTSLCSTYKCHGIVDLGDTTDDRSSIPWTTVEVVGGGIAGLPNLENWKLTGNHEQYLRDTTVNNRRLFDHKFSVIDNREVWDMKGWSAFFVSYPADHEELAQWIAKEARQARGPKALFGHFQVKGAFYQGGKALTGIPAEILEPFDLVLLGHIHLPQAITSKIHYVGSPFQQDWGEVGQTKRVGIFHSDRMAMEWIPMEGYPEYREITLVEFAALANKPSEDRYRVTLNSHQEAELFFRHPNFSRAAAKYAYDETPAAQAVENQDWSFEGILRRYLKTVPPEKALNLKLDEDEMIEMARQILG